MGEVPWHGRSRGADPYGQPGTGAGGAEVVAHARPELGAPRVEAKLESTEGETLEQAIVDRAEVHVGGGHRAGYCGRIRSPHGQRAPYGLLRMGPESTWQRVLHGVEP